MLNKILRLLRFLFWWFVVLITVSVIGFFLWPLLQGKVQTLRSGDWQSNAPSDTIQKTFEQKIKSFFHVSSTATTDILTDESGKSSVKYTKDETGKYIPVQSQN